MNERSQILAFEDEYKKLKKMIEGSMAQIPDDLLHAQINPQQNNIAVTMQHLAGNLRSRFTDFLSTDGEKPWRDREWEFSDRNLPRAQLMDLWEAGWNCVFTALGSVSDADLNKPILIRNEPHTVLKALVRSISHCAWHASQVALIAKHFKGEGWNYLTIRPQGSADFNRGKAL